MFCLPKWWGKEFMKKTKKKIKPLKKPLKIEVREVEPGKYDMTVNKMYYYSSPDLEDIKKHINFVQQHGLEGRLVNVDEELGYIDDSLSLFVDEDFTGVLPI